MVSPEAIGPRSPFLWTRGIAARETLKYLEQKGINTDPLMSRAGLVREQLIENPGGVSAAAQNRFLELAATEANDALLGLHVAAEMDLRSIGLLYYLQAASRTVAEALEYLKRYSATENDEISLEIVHQGEETIVIFRRLVVWDEPPRQHSELIALAFIRVLCKLTNRSFAPLQIAFVHARQTEVREIHRLLRCPVEFGRKVDSWVLPNAVLKLPIVSEDSHLRQILETHADHLLGQRNAARGLREVVETKILDMLPSGHVQSAAVAKELGMSVRSFSRQLAHEGTAFGEIIDNLRQRLALRYLRERRISLQQISWLLGYSEVGAFNHAFKRWTGTSPRQARIHLISEAGPRSA